MTGELIRYQQNNRPYRLYSDSDIIVNNDDSSVYVDITKQGVTFRIYNSACYYDGSQFYVTLISRTSGNYQTQNSKDGGATWNTGTTSNFDHQLDGIYYRYFSTASSLGTIICMSFYSTQIALTGSLPIFTNYNDYYNYITSPFVTDHWSSVPAISGKNGILSLPTLVDTDGEPISGQSTSAFSSLPEGSNVRALINGAL